MLTYADTPSIHNGVRKRLSKERGVEVIETKALEIKDGIRVSVMLLIDNAIVTKSMFDLPPQFYLRQLHNEIDEIAEHAKTARRRTGLAAVLPFIPIQKIEGTGMRGRWPK